MERETGRRGKGGTKWNFPVTKLERLQRRKISLLLKDSVERRQVAPV